ncbi:MAG: TAXI family TRAP transporter solute-binding subunit [Desulfomonilaceae bacterium]
MLKYFKFIKKRYWLSTGIVLAVLSSFLMGYAQARPTKSSRISLLMATGAPGGVDYQVGLGLASLWTTKLKSLGIRVSAAISEGARENIEAIRIADADLIMADEFFCKSAYFGLGIYKDRPLEQLRSITILWPELLHLIVRSERFNSGSIQDLEGLMIGSGLPDSSSRYITEQLLKDTLGTKKDYKIRTVTNIGALEAWKAGSIQALSLAGGLPIPSVNFFAQQNQGFFRFIPLSESDIGNLRKESMPDVVAMKIPAGTYLGQDEDIQTVGQNNILGVTVALDTQVIYELTKTIFENLDYLSKIHPACANISLNKAVMGLKVPLHPGAIRYYREKKIPIPQELCVD